jgi:hypothetical protein
MRSFFDDIVTAIKSECPNARISWDISAWLTESAQQTWWGFFATSTNIDYIHTSGYFNKIKIFKNYIIFLFQVVNQILLVPI